MHKSQDVVKAVSVKEVERVPSSRAVFVFT
jgi:hypothetical protein